MAILKLINILIFILFSSITCLQGPKKRIEITKDYIINDYWKNDISNFFEIEKMKVKRDSILDIFQPGFKFDIVNHKNITQKLETDSTFVYHYRSYDQNTIKGDTIYFGKVNYGYWYKKIPFITPVRELEVLGVLETKTWYKFSGLRDIPFYVYVFVDSVGSVHRFDQNLSNF